MTGRRQTSFVAGVIVVSLLLVSTATVATAAVSGTLSAEYDAESSTDVPGREIAVSGTVEVTGEGAAQPRIAVRSGQDTVLDASSVEVFVEGSRTVDFTRQVTNDEVVYTAEEIASGTTLRVNFVVYPKSTGATNVTAGTVEVQFTSSGARQQRAFSASADLSDSPQARASELSDRVEQLESQVGGPDWQLRFFILLGISIAVILAILIVPRLTGGPPSGSG